jgi:flagellar hook protein FlgE
MASFSIPLSGLNADSEDLSAIANNLANMNTVGYKATSAQFSDLLYQAMGSNGTGDPIQIGAGTTVNCNSGIFTQGSTDTTGVDTDMEIEGQGFFVLQNGNEQLYTRSGNFTVAANGALQASDGSNVMGYGSVDGAVDSNQPISAIMINEGQTSPANATSNFQMSLNLDASDNSVGAATTAVSGTINLDSNDLAANPYTKTQTVYDSQGKSHTLTYTFTNEGLSGGTDNWNYSVTINDAGATPSGNTGTLKFNPATGVLTSPTSDISGITFSNLSDGASPLSVTWNVLNNGTPTITQSTNADSATLTADGSTLSSLSPTYTTTQQVFDALGGSHNLTYNFWKTGSNAWSYDVTIPAADVSGATDPVTLTSGTMTFDGAGNCTAVTVDPGQAGKVTDPITGAAATVGNISGIGALPSGGTLADGANALNFNWNLFNVSGTTEQPLLTQAASASSASNIQQNGYASGSLQTISVQSNGTIEGVFSNGQSQAIAQVALASFTNEEGLSRVGNNDFQQTLASGNANIGVAGVAGRGTIEGGALEASNVDIATEFSNLILAQRAYESNARTVTTFDTIYQDTINLIQV